MDRNGDAARSLVGREHEIERLDRFLDRLTAGPGACVIAGEPGIGKTSLWNEGTALAASRGYRVCTATAVEAEAKLSFAGLGDLLERTDETELSALPDIQRESLEVALLRARPIRASRERLSVSVALLGILRVMARDQPVVLAIDDVQWLDMATAHALAFVMRRVRDDRVGLLATLRTEPGPPEPSDLLNATVGLSTSPIEVGPLTMGAMGEMLKTHLRDPLPRPVLVEVHRSSRGNPLLAISLAESVVATGSRSRLGDPLPAPEALRRILERRLDQLSPPTRDVLLLASAMNHPTEAVLATATGGPVTEALEEAVGADILDIRGGIRFVHPMFSSVAYWSVPQSRRMDAHRRLAAAVTDQEERARHLALGTEPPDEAVATSLDLGAASAAERGATDVAAQLAEEAAHFTSAENLEASYRRRLGAAEYRYTAGEPSRAQSLLQDLLVESTPAPQRAQALWQLARIQYMADSFPAADELLERGLVEAGDDIGLRATIERAASFTAVIRGDIPRAQSHARSALKLADQVGDQRLRASALSARAVADFLLGLGVDHSSMEEAMRVGEREPNLPVEWSPEFSYAWLKLYSGDLTGARSLLKDGHHRARDEGDEGSVPALLIFLGLLECWAGKWDAAAVYADEAIQTSRETRQTFDLIWSLYVRALVDALLGLPEQARAEEALALAEQAGAAIPLSLCYTLLGFLALSRGDAAEADRRLAPLTAMVEAMGVAEPGAIRFLPDEIEALVALGELDRASALATQLEERGRALDRAWAVATGLRCRGLVAGAQGETDDALAAFDDALKWHERLGMPFELGRTLLGKGQVERRAKRWGPARESLQRALAEFDELGAALWADKARAELARIGGRRRSAQDLTETERQVAERIAAGGSTKEVAEALFLSPKTVQNTLSRVYAKLGIRSRTELAASLGREQDR